MYTLINTNCILNCICTHTDIQVIFGHILSIMDEALTLLINNGIKTKVNFDHLQCVYTNGLTLWPIDVIKFDMDSLQFVAANGMICNIENGLNFIYASVKGKLSGGKNKTGKIMHVLPKVEAKKDVVVKEDAVKDSPEKVVKSKVGTASKPKADAKMEEKKNVFEANKRAYYMLEQDILDGKTTVDKISELFKEIYPIYKFMDNNNLLETENEFPEFTKIYDALDLDKEDDGGEYEPHNVNYLSEEKKCTVQKDMFGKQICPSLEDVLQAISDDETITII